MSEADCPQGKPQTRKSDLDRIEQKLDLAAFASLKAAEIEKRVTNEVDERFSSAVWKWTGLVIGVVSVFGITGLAWVYQYTRGIPERIKQHVEAEFKEDKIKEIVQSVAGEHTREYAEKIVADAATKKLQPLDQEIQEINQRNALASEQLESARKAVSEASAETDEIKSRAKEVATELERVRATEDALNARIERLDELTKLAEVKETATYSREALDELRTMAHGDGSTAQLANLALVDLLRTDRVLSEIPSMFNQMFVLGADGQKRDVSTLNLDEQFDLLGNSASSLHDISNFMAIIRQNHSKDEITRKAVNMLRTDKRTTVCLASAGILRSLHEKYDTDFSDFDGWIKLYDEGKLK